MRLYPVHPIVAAKRSDFLEDVSTHPVLPSRPNRGGGLFLDDVSFPFSFS
ncbi:MULTISPECIES: hypothetical protein [unclassified Mesorhizobium]|nr:MULTISPECIES: hypothetical protein [unclassified Mesorhizobium]